MFITGAHVRAITVTIGAVVQARGNGVIGGIMMVMIMVPLHVCRLRTHPAKSSEEINLPFREIRPRAELSRMMAVFLWYALNHLRHLDDADASRRCGAKVRCSARMPCSGISMHLAGKLIWSFAGIAGYYTS